ncbi:Neutral/alkaline nonlysosomal ceramidase [Cynara cardunculus var. scolymus]|uniref:Neutral ceramidase n=1 Tax=Cynara cardunculus var. scolymus TaxID=59895 RepID=A0A103Y9X8_CYNCS|nr:Neutral/alkaline nonlysosomal ceramidase [Cynara cardunculus var. scolymus]
MMGYANLDQSTAGIHFRLRARAFIVAESLDGPRIVFINLDAGMASQLVTIKVLERLSKSHAGPGGYLQYVLYSVTSLGFVPQSFDAIVTAIEMSILQAHQNLNSGSIFINKGDLDNAGVNRSPSAYLFNPPGERARYPRDVDTLMTLVKFVDGTSQRSIGAFTWFATHGTSMSKDNTLISGDNKGAAARFFEDWFTSTTTNSTTYNAQDNMIDVLIKRASDIKATGGQSCGPTTSQGFKVRKNNSFVGAFCQSNVGDLTGKIDYRHIYLDFTNIEVSLDGNRTAKTCPAAVGAGFAAGTTDGPGAFGFQQGDTKINEFWKRVRDFLQKPSDYQVECQKPKPVLLSTGEMFFPYAWASVRLIAASNCSDSNPENRETSHSIGSWRFARSFSISKIMDVEYPDNYSFRVFSEFTTMSGRRLRESVKQTLISSGNGEFDNDTHIVIAGLTNTYSQYIATPEEYEQQRYEAASTLYGPHTLPAYIQEFNKLAESLAKGGKIVHKGPSPPDLSSVQLKLLPDPSGDSPPPGLKFGDMKHDVSIPKSGFFGKGDKPSAVFWSPNPRYDLLTEGTYAVVEKLQGERWVPAYDDDDFSLIFKWNVDNSSTSGLATLEWEVPDSASTGIYRFRHFSSSKKNTVSTTEYFTGASSAFTVS